jgi:16S rRNA (cytosine1402-N4)-methyltransferase
MRVEAILHPSEGLWQGQTTGWANAGRLARMELPSTGHDPVLLRETLELLNLRPGAVVVDCTLGRGGHAAAMAERIAPDGVVLALDADPRNLEFARERLAGAPARIRFFHANFAELGEVLEQAAMPKVDGILADLGISTNQLFDPRYGLSFGEAMPLDMRIDPRTRRTAADLVNTLPERDLADVLYNLAQERYSRRIARKIADARRFSPIMTTDRLAELVRSAIPSRGGPPSKIDPATKTFMALRMAVNQEVENLAALLEQAPRLLRQGGRVAVISFHSTEDRMVKQAFRSAEQAGLLRALTKKPLAPADDELAQNPRSRSAKLRVGERV